MHFLAYDLTKPGRPFKCPTLPGIDLGIAPFTGNSRLMPCSLWKYLGFFFDSRLSFTSHITFYFSKAFSTIRALRMLGNSIKGLDCDARAKIFKVAALPVLTYGAPLYWKHTGKGSMTLLKKMATVQNAAARWMISAFKTTPSDACSLLAGFSPLAASLDKILDAAHRRWQQLPPNHGVSQAIANPDLKFIHQNKQPSWMVQTPKGPIIVTPRPRAWKDNFTHPSPV